MKINKFLLLAMAAVTFFTSCESDDPMNEIPGPDEQGDYSNGVFILNEGNFGSGNSSVTFLNAETEELSHNIFSEVNEGAALGDVAQSMSFNEDLAFIVLNVSNKIEVVNRNTFESIATIDEGLQNPRFVAFSNGFAYVTNWGDGSDPEDDYVAVINTETYEITENISVVEGPETIIEENGNLYVAHLGGYSFNNVLTVIDPAQNLVAETITVGDRPNSLEVNNGFLWVTTGGLPSYAAEETAGKIVKIDLSTNEIAQEYTFSNTTDHPGNLEIEENMVYYTLGNSVFRFNTDDEQLPETAFAELEDVTSLYGFEVANGNIYAASANSDFTGNGDLYVYSTSDGSLINSYEVGINPNGIYFNE